MSIHLLPISEICEVTIKELFDNQVSESKYLDYKMKIDLDNPTEILKDVSSFANTFGGMIIYGISEANGLPAEVCNVPGDADQIIRSYESIIRTGLTPTIIGVEMKFVKMTETASVFIVKIPKSYNSPHMVIRSGQQRFYLRNSRSSDPMTHTEIKDSFQAYAILERQIDEFISERYSKIMSDSAGTKLMENKETIVLHVIPFASIRKDHYISPRQLSEQRDNLVSFDDSGITGRYNFNGYINIRRLNREEFPYPHAYTQLFRSGIIETVDKYLLDESYMEQPRKMIPIVLLENEVIKLTEKYLTILNNLIISPPTLIQLALFGIEGYGIPTNHPYRGATPIQESFLILPEIVLHSYPQTKVEIENQLKPIFDALWNAAGYPGSLYYGEDGNRLNDQVPSLIY